MQLTMKKQKDNFFVFRCSCNETTRWLPTKVGACEGDPEGPNIKRQMRLMYTRCRAYTHYLDELSHTELIPMQTKDRRSTFFQTSLREAHEKLNVTCSYCSQCPVQYIGKTGKRLRTQWPSTTKRRPCKCGGTPRRTEISSTLTMLGKLTGTGATEVGCYVRQHLQPMDRTASSAPSPAPPAHQQKETYPEPVNYKNEKKNTL